MRDRDKIKDDAIAHLSDQLMVLSTRLQEIERRQQLLTLRTLSFFVKTILMNFMN